MADKENRSRALTSLDKLEIRHGRWYVREQTMEGLKEKRKKTLGVWAMIRLTQRATKSTKKRKMRN